MSDTLKEIKLICAYGRVSTSIQEDQQTIQAQLLEVRKFAAEKGYTIVREYLDEGWSGDTLARPSLDELRLDAKKGIWDAVLIYDPDRLGRRYSYQELVMDELKQYGVETLFVTVPPIKDINDRIMSGVRGLFAEYERAKISERFRMGKLSRINMGNVMVSEAPYGYSYILNMGKKGTPEYRVGHYIINEEEAVVVRDMFHWIADEGLTLRGVVSRLKDLGVKPRKSKRGVWSTSTLSTLLRNETYIGKAHWGTSYAVIPTNPLKEEKYKKNKKTSRRMRPNDEWLVVSVPRVIEDDLFFRVAKRLKENFASMGRNKKNEYLLSGKMWCTCGRRRTGEGPQQGKHLYYRCTDRVYSYPLPRTCLEGGINARIADDLVWEKLKQVMSDPVLMNSQAKRWLNEKKSSMASELTIDVEAVQKEMTKLKKQEEKYTTAYSEEVITLDQLRVYLAPLKEKIMTLEKKIIQSNGESKFKTSNELPNEQDIELFAKEATEVLHGLNFTSKKAIIGKTIEKISSTQKGLQVHGFINLNKIHVEYFTLYRYCRSSKRGQVHAF
jgi:site-specific DNA recombinase